MIDPLISLIIGIGLICLLSLLFWPNGGLIGYIERMRYLSTRVLQEDALKHIQKAERHEQPPTLESMAGALQISTTRAASLLGELQKKNLVALKGESFHLTASGRDYALRILRAHRLWERYLADETGFEEQAWHELADKYEHQLTPSETKRLSAQLGNPTHDPHGDPIPTEDGDLFLHRGEPMTSMALNTPLRIVHLEDEPETVYAQLLAESLYLGMEIRITESNAQRIRFWADGDEHLLAPIVASSISVVPIPEKSKVEPVIGEPLNALEIGEKGEVIQISPRLRSQERRRMMDLGILPGTIIKAEIESPSGDPTAYRIRGALVAFREEQAYNIRIHRDLK